MAEDEEMERILTIPLRGAIKVPRTKRAPYAVRLLKRLVGRHMKSDNVWLEPPVSELIWKRGMEHPPRKIRIRAVRFEDGLVEVSLPQE
jgi:large subunit ribosomal protein L31e